MAEIDKFEQFLKQKEAIKSEQVLILCYYVRLKFLNAKKK